MAHPQEWIPLQENYFDTPLLSKREKSYLVRKSCEAAQEVVERARSSVQWRHVEKYNDVQIYAGFSRGTYSAEPTSMCGVTTVPASVKEVASLFDLSTTRAMKEFGDEHRGLFYDAVVLYNLQPRSKERPMHQVTAKWIAVKCARGTDDRDFCYLECQDKFIDSSGRRGWVMCLHSIKLPGCEDLSREFGFVRGSFYHSGFIVVESDRPGFVDIIHMLQMNLKQNATMPAGIMRERIAFVNRIKDMLRTKRLNEQRYLSDLELVPKKYRSRCNVCQDSFSLLLLRKMNCRKCGEVVCGACSKDFDVTNAKFLETIKLRICMHCYQLITSGQMQHTSPLDQPRQSTSLSLLGYHDDNLNASVITQMPRGRQTRESQRQTKIFLSSMRGQSTAPRRSSRATRETEPGHMHQRQTVRYNPQDDLDPAMVRRYSSRPISGGVPPPRPRSSSRQDRYSRANEHSYGYNGPPPAAPPRTLPPRSTIDMSQRPESLFDRPTSGIDSNGRRRGDSVTKQPMINQPMSNHAMSNQPVPLSRPSSRNSFKIPESLYDYNTPVVHQEPPRSPVQRDSTSSVSSTGSIDIDAYDANAAKNEPAQRGSMMRTTAHDARSPMMGFKQIPGPPALEFDDDTEGSIGSESEPELMAPVVQRKKKLTVETYDEEEYYDGEEETKAEEYSATPALPPPSPSAYLAMKAALSPTSTRDSTDFPFRRSNFSIPDDPALNTANCDTKYLDSEMRLFHGQPFVVRDGRSSIDQGRVSGSLTASSSHASELTVEASPASREPFLAGAPSSPTSPDHGPSRPPLYGRPRKSSQSSAKSGGRMSESRVPSETLMLPAMGDHDATEKTGVKNGSVISSTSSGGQFDTNATMLSSAPSAEDVDDLAFAVPDVDNMHANDNGHVVIVPTESKPAQGRSSHSSALEESYEIPAYEEELDSSSSEERFVEIIDDEPSVPAPPAPKPSPTLSAANGEYDMANIALVDLDSVKSMQAMKDSGVFDSDDDLVLSESEDGSESEVGSVTRLSEDAGSRPSVVEIARASETSVKSGRNSESRERGNSGNTVDGAFVMVHSADAHEGDRKSEPEVVTTLSAAIPARDSLSDRNRVASSGRRSSQGRTSEEFVNRSSEAFVKRSSEASANRSSEAFVNRSSEASRSSEAFVNRSSEAFVTRSSEVFVNRSSEAFDNRASEGFDRRSSEMNDAELFISRDSESPEVRNSEVAPEYQPRRSSERGSERSASGESEESVHEYDDRDSEMFIDRASEQGIAHHHEERSSEIEGKRASEVQVERKSEQAPAQLTTEDLSRERPSSQRAVPSYIPLRFQSQKTIVLPSEDEEVRKSENNTPARVSLGDKPVVAVASSNQDEIEEELRRDSEVVITRKSFGNQHESNLPSLNLADDSSESESEQNDLLSARRLFSKFGSTKRLERMVVGVNSNPTFQRTFEQIQESINMLSDSESDGLDSDDEDQLTMRV
ncbi:hypothetical protein Poli38472_007678 [Pythium oligandrum]|uniref:FYVE-type domain-containing protein n=1 Tax=Pythium oligandrum TaxID=41045 RepID=A0A8K1CSU1_PYTOL|nr:hypothetical protein Poli38472_007678 [Pythium oligandrum]|eukprot:TMW68006.1 hypothetical protein Poli38472_007678 [Pythium oligandrum]